MRVNEDQQEFQCVYRGILAEAGFYIAEIL